MTYERLNNQREFWGGVYGMEPLPDNPRNEQQQFYDGIMSSLDIIKFSHISFTEGPIEKHSKNVRLSELGQLSQTSSSIFVESRRLQLYLEYETNEERRIGLRNGDAGIVFVLNKNRENCEANIEIKEDSSGDDWIKKPSSEIPISDAIVLVTNVLRDVKY